MTGSTEKLGRRYRRPLCRSAPTPTTQPMPVTSRPPVTVVRPTLLLAHPIRSVRINNIPLSGSQD